MTSEIRANTLKNRVGLGTVSFTNTGPVVSGIITSLGADINGDLDVDGHTNLDNVSVVGVASVTGNIDVVTTGTNVGVAVTQNGTGNILNLYDGSNLRFYVNQYGNPTVTSGNPVIASTNSSSSVTTTLFSNSSGQGVLQTNSGHSLTLGTGGVEKLRITGNGHVNIGGDYAQTTYKLKVTGTSYFDGVTTTSDNIHIKADNKQLIIGAHNDGDTLLYHDGNKSVLVNYTGDFHIRTNNGSRSSLEGIILKPNGATEIYHSGSKVIETDSLGVNVDGRLDIVGTGANDHLNIGTNTGRLRIGGYADLQLFHDSTNINYISSHNDIDLHIVSTYGGSPVKTQAKFIHNGAVELYHNNDKRLSTWSDAVNIYGDEGEDAILHLYADDGDDNNDKWMLRAESSASRFSIENYSTGSWVENIRITAGNMVELKHADGTTKFQTTSTGVSVANRITAGGDSNTYMNLGPNDIIDLYTGGTNLIRMDASGNLGIKQASPQALLHIGNYETTENVDQSSVTQYFIDSTKSLKIARCDRGSIINAAWYDVAVLANSGYSYRCQVSIGGNFTQDVVDIDVQMAYGATLGNKYSMQIHAKSACAHSNDRIVKVRVAEKSSVCYLQVYLQNVNSQVNGKSVLETTCGIYAQNGADNAYPMFAEASGTYSNICTTFPDFGVHASWDITVNSSHVRSYTALTGGGQVYITAENAGNGSSHGTVGKFTAPMRGLYQVNLNAKSIITPSRNNQILLSLYGSMTYDSQNVWTTNSEIYDVRGAVAGAQGQQGEGNSWYFRMAAYDYFSIDWYRPAAGGYTNGGGDIFNISVLKMG